MKKKPQLDVSQSEPVFATKEEAEKMRPIVSLWKSLKRNNEYAAGNGKTGRRGRNEKGSRSWSANKAQAGESESSSVTAPQPVLSSKVQKQLELDAAQREASKLERERIAKAKAEGIQRRAEARKDSKNPV